jgi:hypothetical protein
VGPIYGYFKAIGSTSARLHFDAEVLLRGPLRVSGYRLDDWSDYSVQEFFQWIQERPWFSGPVVNYVIVQVDPPDDLTFGGVIFDEDFRNPDDVLFRGEYTLPAGEIVPGRYTIGHGNIELSVLVDVIVGPQAGDLPDLAITTWAGSSLSTPGIWVGEPDLSRTKPGMAERPPAMISSAPPVDVASGPVGASLECIRLQVLGLCGRPGRLRTALH